MDLMPQDLMLWDLMLQGTPHKFLPSTAVIVDTISSGAEEGQILLALFLHHYEKLIKSLLLFFLFHIWWLIYLSIS